MPPTGEVLLEQALEKALAPIREQVQQIQAEVKTLSQSFSASADLAQGHPAGLCSETDCEICVAQGNEISHAAFALGRAAMVQDIDGFLLQAGGEPLRERVAQVVLLGQSIVEEQGLLVNADA